MRHSNAGPTSNIAKAKNAAPSSPSSSSTSPRTESQGGVVKVFAADNDNYVLAQFEAASSVAHVLHTLQLLNGGLKVKGGSDTFLSDDVKLAAGDYVVIGSSGIRLRVVWKGNKLVVPYPFPSHQVNQLHEEIASRFSRFHTGESELKMAEIRTIDGYLINKYDRIMEAVHEGDVLEAIDFESWLKEQAQLCKETWLEVTQSDFVDETSKWATVGKHSHGKLFVQTGHGKIVDRLELFEIEDLKVFAKEGQQQILTSKGNKDNFEWHASASFTVSPSGLVTAVRLEVRALSDVRPVIKEVKININGKQLTKGDAQTIQLSEDDDSTEEKPVPENKRTEKLLAQPVPIPDVLPNVSVQAFQRLKIEQIDPIFADQSWASDGVFNNNFYLHFSFSNPGDTIVTVAKVKTEYEAADGSWIQTRSAIGYKNGFYDYRWNYNISNFRLDKHAIENYAILCSIPIKAPQIERNRRAHHSLPNPLKIRTTFEDDQGSTSSIDLLYYNKPHELPTKESVEKYNSKTYDFWTQLDDVDTESRHYVAIARVKENEKEYLDIKCSISSSTYYFYRNDFRKYAFEAVKKGVNEVEIEQLASTSGAVEAHCYAVVDTDKRSVYALKWTIKTPTNDSVDYYRFKPLLNN